MECKNQLEECGKRFDTIDEKLDEISRRLFMDNGSQCLQSKVNENTQNIKRILGVFGFIGTIILAVIGWILHWISYKG